MNLKSLIRLLKTSPWLAPVLAGINAVLFLTDVVAILITPKPKNTQKTLLVIRLDVLGDYLLFRNYLRVIRQSARYQHHRLVFAGNSAVKSIAETFDGDVIDEFIWTDIYKLSTQPVFRFRFVRQLRQAGADVVFCPTFSRVLVLDDFLAWASGATERVGCQTNYVNIKQWEASFGSRLYTRLIDSGPGIVFEMERNRRIAEGFLQEPMLPQPPLLAAEKAKPVSVPARFVVFSLGAGQDFRIWPAERFAAIADDFLTQHPDYELVLTGAPNEKGYADAFLNTVLHQNKITDLTGQLSLPELVFVLTHASGLLTNETGIVHIAASTETPTVVISQGKSLVRWHPYPATFGTYIQHLYPDFVEQHRADLSKIASQFNPESPYLITDISVEKVRKAIQNRLNRPKKISNSHTY